MVFRIYSVRPKVKPCFWPGMKQGRYPAGQSMTRPATSVAPNELPSPAARVFVAFTAKNCWLRQWFFADIPGKKQVFTF
jgi:hypothetical protein